MKHCKNCNAEINEHSKFCTFCGSLQDDSQVPPEQPSQSAPLEQALSTPPQNDNPFLAAAQSAAPAAPVEYQNQNDAMVSGFNKIFTSKAWLTICIIFTVATTFSLISTIISVVFNGTLTIISSLISLVILFLLFVAGWICYTKARRHTNPTSGFSIFHGVSVFFAVIYWLVTIFLTILSIMILALGNQVLSQLDQTALNVAVPSSVVATIGVFLLFLSLVIIVIGIFLIGDLLKYTSSTIRAMDRGMPILRAKRLSVFFYIIAAFSLVGTLIMTVPALTGMMPQYLTTGSIAAYVFELLLSIFETVGIILLGQCISRSDALNDLRNARPVPPYQSDNTPL